MAINLKWKQLFIGILVLDAIGLQAAIPKKIKYKTSFNNCPSQAAGKFAMRALKTFEEKNSLYEVKSDIRKNFLRNKYFIKSYSIEVDPIENILNISLKCPKPLLRGVLMNSEAKGEFESVLVEDGDLFDPTYETLLVGEKKIRSTLPTLAINKESLTDINRAEISRIIMALGSSNFDKIGEVIYDKDNALTIILSHNRKPVSVFMGKGNYHRKARKLSRLLSYVEENNKQPTVINLVNLKKVVVKFAHKK